MADECDKASEIEREALARALAQHFAKPRGVSTALGYCQNALCGDEFPAGDNRLYCDGHCATEAGRYDNNRG